MGLVTFPITQRPPIRDGANAATKPNTTVPSTELGSDTEKKSLGYYVERKK